MFTTEIFNLNEMQTWNELLSSFEEFKVKGQMNALGAWEYSDLSETRKQAKIYIKIKNVTGKMTDDILRSKRIYQKTRKETFLPKPNVTKEN